MRILVKVLKGSECAVSISSGASIMDIKQQLQSQVSIPVDQQKLIYQGKALLDEKTIEHYKIGDGAKLFLMLKKPGAGATPATSSSTPSQTPIKSPDVAPMAVDTPQEEEFTLPDDPSGFWKKLSDFLKRHFTDKDAIKVLKEFKKNHDRGLNSLSLDDIERLAANKLRNEDKLYHSLRS
ncbi:ubiquitin-like protein 4A [Ruditapes philippinarum]|uniref:ubiquitin-like protein 4A n=1 Tax=Ruditapes philippinarum TaxID=129788 RepID=UPI00295ACDCE|nr:ubiquitin-like protein 4A [Ruditapes philippinarum]